MRDGDRHVVPNPAGGWDVKAENAKRASSHHETQAEAIERAREIIRNKGGGELSVHGEDGQIRQKDTVAAGAPSTGGTGAVNPAPESGMTARGATEPASKAGDPTPMTDTPRDAGGMAQTGPTPAAATVRPSQQRPSVGARIKGLFSRSKG